MYGAFIGDIAGSRYRLTDDEGFNHDQALYQKLVQKDEAFDNQ